MKSIKTLIVAFVAVLSLASCKKDKGVELTTAQKILGKWSLASVINVETAPSLPKETDTYIGKSEDYIEFKADGKVFMKADGEEDDLNYTIKGDTQITISNLTYEIQKLDNHSLVLYSKEVYNNGLSYSEYTLNLTR